MGKEGEAIKPAKLPLIAPYDSPESIVLALQTRELPLLTSGLVQLEKRALALVAKPAPRAQPDAVLDYLAKYPTTDGVFAAWDTAHRTNNSQLSAAVLSSLSALIRLVSTDPFSSEPEVIRRLLSQYGSHLDRALNPGRNDVTVAALKLCNVVVGFGSGRFARRLFASMAWSPKIITRLFRTRLKDTSRDPLLKPDIRTLLTMLVLAFLSTGDSRLKNEVLEMKGLVSGITKGLSEDPEVVVNHVLVALYRDVVVDRSVGLEVRRGVFDEPTIVELCKLYSSSDSDDEETDRSVRVSVHRFLYALTEWLADQINASITRSFGPQKVLGTVLKTLAITEDPQQRELGLYILQRAPILAGPFWARFPSSLDPRLSSRWISAITFATQIVSLPVSLHLTPSITTSTTPSPPALSSILDNILPPSLTKTWYSKALLHENPLVSFLSSIFILAALQKATKVIEALAETSRKLEEGESGRWSAVAVRVREHLRTVLPDPQIVVALMQKTAAPTPAALAIEAKKAKAKKKEAAAKKAGEEEAVVAQKDEDDSAGRHLRTNIALRLLWLYHRTVPEVISMLKFDFAKLPQAHVAKTDAEGIRAISSAYALRLASLHSGAAWSRPSDHFKNTLVPLFHLYRTPSTPSNRRLLLSILGRLLSTSTLFGTSLPEVEVWLRALPTPSASTDSASASSVVLDFFESIVEKTLTAPAKAAEEVKDEFSPLLVAFLSGIQSEVKKVDKKEEKAELLEFVRVLVLGFVGFETRIAVVKKLVGAVEERLGEVKEAKGSLRVLGDVAKVLEGKVEVESGKVEEKEGSERSPVRENVFVAAGEDMEKLSSLIAVMPIELVMLHVRPSDLSASSTTTTLLLTSLASLGSTSSLIAAQVLLHRFVNVKWEDVERSAISAFLVALVEATKEERGRERIKAVLFGTTGLLAEFQEKKAPFASIAQLIGATLSPSKPADVALAKQYCSLVLADVQALEQKKSSKTKKISPRILAAGPLLPFLDESSAVAFAEALLSGVPLTTLPLDDTTSSLFDAALSRANAVASTAAFRTMWVAHFSRLHQLSTKGGLESAGTVLASGAQALLPFILSTTTPTPKISSDTFRYGTDDLAWREHVTEWTTELLAESSLRPAQATVLAALVYRSPATRTQFVNWLKEHADASADFADGTEPALRALLEVNVARKVATDVPASIATRFTERVLDDQVASEDENLRRVICLLSAASSATSLAVSTLLAARIPEIGRDAHLPGVLHLLSDLAVESADVSNLELFVNGSFAGLVRRFAEDEEDTEAVTSFVRQLNDVVAKHGSKIAFKSHLLDPLFTAAITRRLDKAGPTALATTLCLNHNWKENEVTRLLNNVYASAAFQPRSSTDAEERKVQFAIIALVSALAKSSIASAASTRIVERLMPFYGGSLSKDDAVLLDLFQRVEIVSGSPISVAFKSWNPSLDQSPLEDTKVAALRSLQVAYVRRSWLRVCASSTTTFPAEHDAITYDPHFLLSYLRQALLEEEWKPQDWTGVLESGVLGLPIAALGSSSTGARLNARATLASALKKVEASAFKEKEEVLLVLRHARNCIYSQAGEAIPAVMSLFLANCMGAIGTPDSPLYPAFNRFLLQRPVLDQRDLPMFYLLFYTSSEEPEEDHKWLLRFMAEGLVRSQDWRIYRRRQTFELLASLLQSSRQNPALRKLVLQFLLRATSIPAATWELVSRNGLVGWLSAQTPVDASERRLITSVVSNVVDCISYDRPGTVTDALDTVLGLCVVKDYLPSELAQLCKIISKLIARLPATPSTAIPHRLILERARDILSFVAAQLSSEHRASQAEFYRAVVLVGFARHSSGLEESQRDRELFNAGVRAGLSAGDEELKRETLVGLSG